MKAMSRIAAAMPFAHLLSLAKHAEDEEGKKAKRAEEEQEEEAHAEEEEEQEEEAARADEQDGDGEEMESEEGDEEDDSDGDEKKGKKARKAKSKGRAEEESEEGDEKDGDKSARSAIRRERARCAKIIAHGINTGRVRQAGVLAFDTNLSVKAAIATLDAGAPDQPQANSRKPLAERMAETSVPNVGADGGGKTPAGVTKTAAAIIAVGEKLRAGK